MSKRERGGKKEGEEEHAKVVKTADSEETASIRDVNAFAEELAGAAGPDLLLAIRKALSSPDLFTFGEVLDVASVAALRTSDSPEDKRHHSLLLLFAYETFSTYRANVAVYGPLSPVQERKLRQLSIVSLSARHKKLTYADLMEELQIWEVRQLEDLLLDTIYQGLISGKLDSKNEFVTVHFAIGRDVRSEDLEEIQRILSNWQDRATKLIQQIDSRVNEARGRLQQDTIERAQFNARVQDLQEKLAKMTVKKGPPGGGGSAGGGGGHGGYGGGGGSGGYGGREGDGRRKRTERGKREGGGLHEDFGGAFDVSE